MSVLWQCIIASKVNLRVLAHMPVRFSYRGPCRAELQASEEHSLDVELQKSVTMLIRTSDKKTARINNKTCYGRSF